MDYKVVSLSALVYMVTCSIFSVSSEIYFEKGSPHVKLSENAILSGSIHNSRAGRPFSAFLGIPYAIIPERFQESQLLSTPAWDGVKSFTEPGPICFQKHFDGSNRGAETCLTANVFIPINATKNEPDYPVMVWIHEGGFTFGNGYGDGPKYFMDENVILVNFNYRLGVFGFISTGDSVIPGNNGLKDMRTLLVWVQQNIDKFGGNRDKVTIFGESAGGSAVHYLLLSASTKGLFHRAISASGGASALSLGDPDPRGNAIQLATHLKCPTAANKSSDITSNEILDCLKKVPADELNQAQFEYQECWPPKMRPFYFAPCVEPEGTPNIFLTESPISILSNKTNRFRDIPWILGTTQDEGATMFGGVVEEHPEFLEQMNREWDKIAPVAFDYGRYLLSAEEIQSISKEIRKFYFGSETEPITLKKHRENITNLYSDEFITHSIHNAAVETVSREHNAPVYLYQYAYTGPVSVMGKIYGLNGIETKKVSHSDDLQHLFDLSENLFTGASKLIRKGTPDEIFSKNFVSLWVSFAIHGEPKHEWGANKVNATSNAPNKWYPLSKEEVDGTIPMKWWKIDSNPGYIENPYKERMEFWDDLFRKYFIPSVTRNTVSISKSQ